MPVLVNIYAPHGENTVIRLRYDTESLVNYRVRVYATRYSPSPAAEVLLGEANGVAAGENLSIPVFTSDLAAESMYTLAIKKVDSNDAETALTLDRSYDLKVTPEQA